MRGKIINISNESFYSMKKDRDVIIVDLRSNEEYEKKHIYGAINIEFEIFEEKMINFPSEMKTILYCENGGNSLHVAKLLASKGNIIYNLMSGIAIYFKKYID